MPESEWGKLNAGQSYGILAVDVDRALACADLGKYEDIVFQAIRERSWGTSARRKRRGEPWPEAEPARIDLKALAAELGVPWQRLYAGRKWLADARLIVPKDGGFMPNKNAIEWVDPRSGSPLLTPAQVAYAARACTRQMRHIQPPTFTPECEPDSRGSVNDDSRGSVNGVHTLHGIPFTRKCEPDSRGSVNSHIEPARVPEDPTGLDPTGSDVCETGTEAHTHGPDEIGSTPQRSAEDQALVSDAGRILAGQLATQHLGTELLRCQNLPDLVALEGWRWILAANRVQSSAVSEAKRRSWHYLVAVARNLSDADRFASAAGVGPHVNGSSEAIGPSKAELRRQHLRAGIRALKLDPPPTEGGRDGR